MLPRTWHTDDMRLICKDQTAVSGNAFLGTLINKKYLDMQVERQKKTSESDLRDGIPHGMCRVTDCLI